VIWCLTRPIFFIPFLQFNFLPFPSGKLSSFIYRVTIVLNFNSSCLILMLTNDTTSKRFHLTVRIGILLISILFLYLFLWFTYCSSDTFIVLDFFYSNVFRYSLSLTLTPFSMIFSSLVSAITGIVFMYSYRYIGFYSNYKFFLLTTFGFVVSILIVINFTDMFIVMLG